MNTEPITDQDTVPTEPTHRRALAVPALAGWAIGGFSLAAGAAALV